MSEYKGSCLVLGAGGFIGNAMVSRLKREGYWVRGVDLKHPEFNKTEADEFLVADLRVQRNIPWILLVNNNSFDEIYQFAADMGGAGYIFTGEHDAEIMHNSATINLNVLEGVASYCPDLAHEHPKIFYSSSACIYPAYNQMNPDAPECSESSAYPAEPDSEYGWEKLFSERLYASYARNYGIPVRVARYHNIYGPRGTWTGGREKAPAAICRKVIESNGGPIEVWGDGHQTRSFLYIDDCIDATRLLMQSDFEGPVNIGSEEMVSINDLVDMVGRIDNWKGLIKHDLTKPQGVRGRNSDNKLIEEKLGWKPKWSLERGIEMTYEWIYDQINKEV